MQCCDHRYEHCCSVQEHCTAYTVQGKCHRAAPCNCELNSSSKRTDDARLKSLVTCTASCEQDCNGAKIAVDQTQEEGAELHLPGSTLVPGYLPGQELPHDHSKTVHIAAKGVAAARQNLRS